MATRYNWGQDSRRCWRRMGGARSAAVRRLLGDGPGDVLDAGMGPGRLLAELADRGWTVTGADLSGEMVARARQRVPAARDRLMRGDIEALPFPDESFDAVVVTGVLEYVAYRVRALQEVARVLRPGGRAVVSIPTGRGRPLLRLWRSLAREVKRVIPLGRPNRPPGPRPPGRDRFERTMEAAGLSVSSVEYVGRRGSTGGLRGTQIVFAARKTGEDSP